MLTFLLSKKLACHIVGLESEPEPHQKCYPEPHKNYAAPQHGCILCA
jgi:hypothetical protein